jgi:hypothetical protein
VRTVTIDEATTPGVVLGVSGASRGQWAVCTAANNFISGTSVGDVVFMSLAGSLWYQSGLNHHFYFGPSERFAILGSVNAIRSSSVAGTAVSSANVGIDANNILGKVSSSLRYKEAVTSLPAEMGLNLVRKLRPVTYQFKGGDARVSKRRYMGLVAEEVAAAGGELLVDFEQDGRPQSVFYDHLTAALVAAVQEMDRRLSAAGL